MSDDDNPNAYLFGGDEPEKDEEQTFVEYVFEDNHKRVQMMDDLFGSELVETANSDKELSQEARQSMIFKMTANSVLDIVMESLSPEVAEEVVSCINHYLAMGLVNRKFSVDVYKELSNALDKVEQGNDESDEDFSDRLDKMADEWWDLPQPLLGKRSPRDSLHEELLRYGLDD